MFRKIIWICMLGCSLVFAQSALADCGCGEGMKSMIESLKLTSEQKEKVKPILEQMKNTMKENGQQMDALKQQMHQLVTADSMDQSGVDSLIDQKTKMIGNMMRAKMKAKHDIFVLLTPEQKKTFQSQLNAKERKMAEKFKHCHDKED